MRQTAIRAIDAVKQSSKIVVLLLEAYLFFRWLKLNIQKEISIAAKITTTAHVTENTAMFISEYSTEKSDVGAEFSPSEKTQFSTLFHFEI